MGLLKSREVKIGDVIREERKKRGISQDVLAGRLGVTVQAVSKWETRVSLPISCCCLP